jgi:hypothetical protein
MSRNDDTIEQLRFLAENWHRFSSWTRLQILLTIWWYVKVRRPLKRMAIHVGEGQIKLLLILVALLLLAMSFTGLSHSITRFQPHLALLLALMSAVFLFGLGMIQSGK